MSTTRGLKVIKKNVIKTLDKSKFSKNVRTFKGGSRQDTTDRVR